jgi:hypothetical protein
LTWLPSFSPHCVAAQSARPAYLARHPRRRYFAVVEFAGQFDEIDLVQLPNYRIYLKLMIDGSPSRPFSARTLNVNTPAKLLA